MDKETMYGLMVDHTKESIKWIKKMDMENILGYYIYYQSDGRIYKGTWKNGK